MKLDKVIKTQVDLLRKGYNIKIFPEEVEKLCNECDKENFKFAIVNNLGYEQIRVHDLIPGAPFHRSSLIGFNTTNEAKWFIVDPTYGQFYSNTAFYNYMIDNYEDFSNKILNQGYIECTSYNFTSYLNGFIFSGAFNEITKVDPILIAKKVEEDIGKDLYIKEVKIKTKR